MASCENTWAGRFVITLQLFSWCAVGVLLLQRGVTSIREDVARAPPNATQNRAETNLSDLANILVDKSTSESSNQHKIATKSGLIEKHTEPFEGISANDINKHTGNVHNLTEMTNSSGTVVTSPSILDHPTTTRLNETVKKISTSKTASTFHNVRVPSAAAGKKYELTPSGAVMAAIGALMLIVGPAIVVVRCCESYSQGRRFNKLSANERALYEHDLPPTYEEVEGRAPRYSMLFPDPEESNQSMLPDPEESSA